MWSVRFVINVEKGPSIFKHQIHPVVRNAPVAERVKIAQTWLA